MSAGDSLSLNKRNTIVPFVNYNTDSYILYYSFQVKENHIFHICFACVGKIIITGYKKHGFKNGESLIFIRKKYYMLKQTNKLSHSEHSCSKLSSTFTVCVFKKRFPELYCQSGPTVANIIYIFIHDEMNRVLNSAGIAFREASTGLFKCGATGENPLHPCLAMPLFPLDWMLASH